MTRVPLASKPPNAAGDRAGWPARCAAAVLVLAGVSLAQTSAHADTSRCQFNAPGATPVTGGGTNGVNLVVDQQAGNTMSLGTFTRPDVGSASGVVALSPNGTRTLPPTLTIQSDTLNVSRMPRVGVIEVTGGANCKFRIDVDSATGALFSVQFSAAAGYTALSSSNPGATGRLNASGRHVIDMGVSATVDSNPSQTVLGNIVVRATYAD